MFEYAKKLRGKTGKRNVRKGKRRGRNEERGGKEGKRRIKRKRVMYWERRRTRVRRNDSA